MKKIGLITLSLCLFTGGAFAQNPPSLYYNVPDCFRVDSSSHHVGFFSLEVRPGTPSLEQLFKPARVSQTNIGSKVFATIDASQVQGQFQENILKQLNILRNYELKVLKVECTPIRFSPF